MECNEFIKRLKKITEMPTIYYSGGNRWSTWNGKSWNFDCVVSIKSVLWGWYADKTLIHGGAKYLSNNVPDFTCNEGLDYCKQVSTNFKDIVPGEYLCMKGTGYDHAGIYLGDGKVFEVTTAWGVNGATISEIDKYGNRLKSGKYSLKWTYHGKLKWINYEKVLDYKIGDVVKINKVYVSSTSTNPLNPLIKEGMITKIINNARNPYLLNNGEIGWINDDCIIKEYKYYKKVVNCYYLNLRTSPEYGNNIYTVVQSGTLVEYLGEEKGWAKIKYNDKTLYCGKGYLE